MGNSVKVWKRWSSHCVWGLGKAAHGHRIFVSRLSLQVFTCSSASLLAYAIPKGQKVDSIHPSLVYCLNKTLNKRVKEQNEWSSIWIGPERMSRMSSQSGARCAREESPVLCLGFLGLDTLHTLGCITLCWGGGGIVSCALEDIQQHPWPLAIKCQ